MKYTDDNLEWHDENEAMGSDSISTTADRKTEPKPCEWCKFYDGENCFSQEPCKVMLYFKTEPQTDCGDFADRLAYERGVKHAWEVAQKVFDSTVTFYEAEDVAKQIDKDINARSKTMRDCYNCERYENDCECVECDFEPKTEPQTEDKLHDYCKKKNCVWWSRSSTMCLAERNGLACKYKSGKE